MKNRLVNQRYNVIVPDHIADWDAPSEWERVRFLSMEKHLNKGDILYDIGTEQGWQSAIYAQFVGGENMVLVEPSADFWPNIRKTWEANGLKEPKATVDALVGDDPLNTTTSLRKHWPPSSQGDITETMAYGTLNNKGPRVTVDYIKGFVGPPDAISIDVEGAEYKVLGGAGRTLLKDKPKLWISVHPDLMEKDYGSDVEIMRGYLKDVGYKIEDLGWDGHETHWYCS